MIDFSPSENKIMFSAILEALKPGTYTRREIGSFVTEYWFDKEKWSHDNNTALLSFNTSAMPSTFVEFWPYLKNFPFGTIRDICFYLNCKFPRAAYPLRLPLSLVMIWSQLPWHKITPFYERWWIKLTCKYRDMVIRDDDTTWYFVSGKNESVIIRWHKYSLDANLLNILRVSRLQMKWTGLWLDKISFYWSKEAQLNESRCVTKYPIHFFAWKYFHENDDHEIVKASRSRTYSSLIK